MNGLVRLIGLIRLDELAGLLKYRRLLRLCLHIRLLVRDGYRLSGWCSLRFRLGCCFRCGPRYSLGHLGNRMSDRIHRHHGRCRRLRRFDGFSLRACLRHEISGRLGLLRLTVRHGIFGLLGHRIGEQITRSGRLFRLGHGLGNVQTAEVEFVNLMTNAGGAERSGRLTGPQIQNVVNGHISGIRLLRCFIHRVAEQIRHRKLLLMLDVIDTDEVRRNITELHAHRRGRQHKLGVNGQTQ